MPSLSQPRPTSTLEPKLSQSLSDVELFSACPASIATLGDAYLDGIRDVAQWSERHGCSGILVYTDNRLVDPWMVSHTIVESTHTLSPLVAVQPVYMHAYTVANMIATFAALYGRRMHINWVAGGFKQDLEALADPTPHEQRYSRLLEYATVVRKLTDGETVTFEGKYVTVKSLTLRPEVPEALRPVYVMSGSSPAGRVAARKLSARSVTYALPPDDEDDDGSSAASRREAGLRMGIIARETKEEAWRTAYLRFPPDREGSMMRRLARKVSDSHWHERMCRLADDRAGEGTPYWMGPFENYKTMCPYLVGDHAEVAALVAKYLERGYRTFILDEPESEADIEHASRVFEMARASLAQVPA